jgi:hypothetical protein
VAGLRSFYVRLIDKVDGVDVWRVDGHQVRCRLDVEFTNGHHHYSRPYVPAHEIWLDREAPGAGELPFWTMRQQVERARMAAGDDYGRAVRIAGRVEARERLSFLGLTPKDRPTPREIQASVRRRRLGLSQDGRREVWLVDGRAVRDLAFVDFTLGGHGYRYRFIPRGEIWIDDAVAVVERPAVLHHEEVEVGLMAGGMRYDAAHALASEAEKTFRRRMLRRA